MALVAWVATDAVQPDAHQHVHVSRRVFVPLVAATMLLAGCGSSAPTKAQYTARANSICATTSSKTAPLIVQLAAAVGSLGSSGGESATRQLASALHQLHSAGSSALAKLRALKQPTAGHAAIERFLTSFASVNAGLDQAAKTADAGQPQQALADLKKVGPGLAGMTGAARAYGLTTCENVLAAAP